MYKEGRIIWTQGKTDDVEVRSVIVDDDVAVKDSLYTAGRRGVAGTVMVEKIAGAAAERGDSLDEVAAMGQRRVHRYRVEDGALLMARSASGVLVQLHVAYNTPETLPRRRLEVVGTGGQAVATDTMGQTGGGTLELIDAATGVGAAVEVPGIERSSFLNQVEAFAGSVLGTHAFPFTPAGDLAAMAMVLRAQSQVQT